FVGGLADAGADRRGNARQGGTPTPHFGNRLLQHTIESTAPAGVRGTRDARFGIGEQHGRAIRVKDAKSDAGRCRHHGVDLGCVAARPGLIDDGDALAVSLPGGDEIGGIEIGRSHHAVAILRHVLSHIAGAETAIERGIDAFAHATGAAEEAVADAGQTREIFSLDHTSSAKPGGIGRLGPVNASALNRVPISRASVRRRRAASISRAWAGVARPFKISARASRPRRCRNSPWGSGPCAAAPADVAARASAAKSTWADKSAAPGSASTSTG